MEFSSGIFTTLRVCLPMILSQDINIFVRYYIVGIELHFQIKEKYLYVIDCFLENVIFLGIGWQAA